MQLPNLRVIPLPLEWQRNGADPSYSARIRLEDGTELAATLHFNAQLVAWNAIVIYMGDAVYTAEHRERDEAAGACLVAMQRAIDIRHP